MKFKKYILFSIITPVIIYMLYNGIKYSNLNKYIIDNVWVYEKGGKIGKGDFVEFGYNLSFIFKRDTFYVKNKPTSILLKKCLFQNRILIQNLSSNEIGSYRIKGKNILSNW
jgi:hypothetical protein